MKNYGYIRVSSIDQNEGRQIIECSRSFSFSFPPFIWFDTNISNFRGKLVVNLREQQGLRVFSRSPCCFNGFLQYQEVSKEELFMQDFWEAQYSHIK